MKLDSDFFFKLRRTLLCKYVYKRSLYWSCCNKCTILMYTKTRSHDIVYTTNKQCFKIFGENNVPPILSCKISKSSQTSNSLTLTVIAEEKYYYVVSWIEIFREIEFVYFNVSTSRTITHIVNPLLLAKRNFLHAWISLNTFANTVKRSLNCSSFYKIIY